jgi:hypothetical protein
LSVGAVADASKVSTLVSDGGVMWKSRMLPSVTAAKERTPSEENSKLQGFPPDWALSE